MQSIIFWAYKDEKVQIIYSPNSPFHLYYKKNYSQILTKNKCKKSSKIKWGTLSSPFQLMPQVDFGFLGHLSSPGLKQMDWPGDWVIWNLFSFI